jgi:hypothetical protein
MKKLMSIMIFFALSLIMISPAQGRDDKYFLPIAVALDAKEAKSRLDGSVKFFFGNQETPNILVKLGTDVTNLKTSTFPKGDEGACNWVFLSAMIALEKRAKQLGANAVINIVSYYRREVMSSATEFECHAGAIITGVALRGEFVKIAE